MPGEGVQALTAVKLPDAKGAIVRGGDGEAVGGDGHGADPILVSDEGVQALTAVKIPDAKGGIQ